MNPQGIPATCFSHKNMRSLIYSIVLDYPESTHDPLTQHGAQLLIGIRTVSPRGHEEQNLFIRQMAQFF